MVDVLSVVRHSLATLKGISPSEITPVTPLDSFGLDSLDTLELIMDIEQSVLVEVDVARVAECKTVGDLVQAIQNAALHS